LKKSRFYGLFSFSGQPDLFFENVQGERGMGQNSGLRV
jgi:hypothetical protein